MAHHADSSRERFVRTLNFDRVDPAWIRWGSFIWDETVAIWRTQGYDGRPLDDMFGLDRLVRVDPGAVRGGFGSGVFHCNPDPLALSALTWTLVDIRMELERRRGKAVMDGQSG